MSDIFYVINTVECISLAVLMTGAVILAITVFRLLIHTACELEELRESNDSEEIFECDYDEDYSELNRVQNELICVWNNVSDE